MLGYFVQTWSRQYCKSPPCDLRRRSWNIVDRRPRPDLLVDGPPVDSRPVWKSHDQHLTTFLRTMSGGTGTWDYLAIAACYLSCPHLPSPKPGWWVTLCQYVLPLRRIHGAQTREQWQLPRPSRDASALLDVAAVSSPWELRSRSQCFPTVRVSSRGCGVDIHAHARG